MRGLYFTQTVFDPVYRPDSRAGSGPPCGIWEPSGADEYSGRGLCGDVPGAGGVLYVKISENTLSVFDNARAVAYPAAFPDARGVTSGEGWTRKILLFF